MNLFSGYDNDTVEITGLYLHQTDESILLEIDEEEHWFPLKKTVILTGGEKRNQLTEIEIPEWLAMEKELV